MKFGHSALSGTARDLVPTLMACVILARTVAPAQAQRWTSTFPVSASG